VNIVRLFANEECLWETDDIATAVVGRDTSAQICARDGNGISRFHCRIEANPPLCYLTDLDSRNGTFVNGERVSSAVLKDGDVIRVGTTELTVAIRGEHDPATAEYVPDSSTVIVEDLPEVEIPEYQIRRQLGRGRMGVVYEAQQRGTGRIVALKLIHPQTVARDEALQHFVREASILTRLRHRRIVESLEFGLHQRQPYLVMERIETINLQAKLASASAAGRVKLACGIVCQVLEGLQYAHANDIVHRDVKPSNILPYMKGHRVSSKLADFSLAKNFANAGFSDISPDQQAKGSLGYMAPEQVLDSRYANPACDIYAAGACLYKFLCGKTPHDFPAGRNKFSVVLHDAPVPITERVEGLPESVVAVIEKALARDPAERFASAAEMRSRLIRHARSRKRR